MEAMQYRGNFIAGQIVSNAWLIADIIFLNVLVNNIANIGNWSLPQATIALGIYRLYVPFVWGWMVSSFITIPKIINSGYLDIFLAKPIDSQFNLGFRSFRFNDLTSFIVGGLLINYGVTTLSNTVNILNWAIFIWMFAVSLLLIYSFYFLTISFSLFTERLENIYELFPETFFTVSRYPKEIFHGVVKIIFTVVAPISLMVSIPAEAIFFKPNINNIIMLHVFAFIFFALGRVVWIFGLKKYSSASS